MTDVRISTDIPDAVAELAEQAESAGQTTVFVGRGPTAEAVIAVSDTIKPTSADAVAAFHILVSSLPIPGSLYCQDFLRYPLSHILSSS